VNLVRAALRRWLLALAIVLGTQVASADAPVWSSARDLVDVANPSLPVPPLPADYVVERRGPIEIAYPHALESDARDVLRHVDDDAHSVGRRVGMFDLPRIMIRLVPDPATMRQLAPADAPPPSYAVGVAYPSIGLALVSSSAPATWEHADMRRVARHEVAHLLLEAATRHAAIPRWFSEGFAIDASGEHDFERFKALAIASFTRGLVPLSELDAAFSTGPDQVNVAYAESADFVAFLLRTEGDGRFPVLVSHLATGLDFASGIRRTYGSPLSHFESEWRHDVEIRFLTAPLWAGTGFLWLVGLVLLVLAYIRRRARSRATLARWEREERGPTAPAVTVVTPGLRSQSALQEGDGASSSDVPEIALDGKRYTLH
jgi:hypothetical protein